MVMVYVPAGEFLMGSTGAGWRNDDDEQPQHTVYLDAFWIDRTEVTNNQYQKCVEAGACTAPEESKSRTYYGNTIFDEYPVLYVDWNQASAYCQWAGARLPTEAQWEKAARGTEGRSYPWGNSGPDDNKVNFNCSQCVGYTSQVGSYPDGASPYGALDMAGNASEWVADFYDRWYYTNSLASNPKGPDSGAFKVQRGGSWRDYAGDIRAADRGLSDPSNTSDKIGIRCAADSPEG
jgi:serine/threonine-protein kinase